MTSADSRTPIRYEQCKTDDPLRCYSDRVLVAMVEYETELSAANQRAEQAEAERDRFREYFHGEMRDDGLIKGRPFVPRERLEQAESRLAIVDALASSEQHKAQLAEDRLAQALEQAAKDRLDAARYNWLKDHEGLIQWRKLLYYDIDTAIDAQLDTLSPAGGEDGGEK